MSTLTDSSYIFRYHRDMIALHGSQSSFALGWRDKESQNIRFKALAGLADLNRHSIIDAGCGYADLLPYLLNLYPQITYTGIEQIPELLDEAIKQYADQPGTTFISGNFITMNLPAADFILASGSLNYRSTDPQFIFNAIKKLYGGSKLGFGFNLLSDVRTNGIIVAYDPDQIMDYCNSICPNVQLKNDYSDEDFTIFMHK